MFRNIFFKTRITHVQFLSRKIETSFLHLIQLIFALLLLFNLTNLQAQTNLSHVSLKLGTVRNLQNAGEGINYDQYALCPEIEIGGNFILSYLEWEISLNYWDDKITAELPIKDFVSYTNRALSLGSRIVFNLDNFLLNSKKFQFSIFTGAAFQFVKSDPLTPMDIFGKEVKAISENLISTLVGIKLKYLLHDSLSLLAEYSEFIAMGNKYDFRRNSLLGGISLGF